MNIDWSRVAPVLISIGIILFIAVIRQYSRTLAAIAATMPLNIPLSMWIVASGSDNSSAALTEFTYAATWNILPTILFLLVAWQLAKAGYSVVPTILISYAVWGVSLGLLFLIRALLGR